MIINQDIMRRDTVRLIGQIDAQIREVEQEAEKKGVAPHTLRDSIGGWAMTPLLLAKAQAYGSLVLLQTKN